MHVRPPRPGCGSAALTVAIQLNAISDAIAYFDRTRWQPPEEGLQEQQSACTRRQGNSYSTASGAAPFADAAADVPGLSVAGVAAASQVCDCAAEHCRRLHDCAVAAPPRPQQTLKAAKSSPQQQPGGTSAVLCPNQSAAGRHKACRWQAHLVKCIPSTVFAAP